MSANDIAGAVVWTPVALIFWTVTFSYRAHDRAKIRRASLLAVAFTFAAVFCIARLWGAHA